MSKFRAYKFKPKRNFSSRRAMPKSRKVMIWIGSIFTVLVLLLFLINKSISKPLMAYAEIESKEMATAVIRKAVEEQVQENLDMTKVMEVTERANGKAAIIQYNTALTNKLLSAVTENIQHSLHEAKKGNFEELGLADSMKVQDKEKLADGIVYEMPLGMVTNNSLLATLGPKIPVRFTTIGDVQTDVVQRATPSGINNTFVEIGISVQVDIQVILPFVSEKFKVDTTIPITTQMIQGEVPQYFGGSNGNFIPIPVDKQTKGSN
ncbi:sporulation protein YunB [Priestia taiwanensis]|uniref:Sporulation protein YunB n=1 Tax=Priestia taiwanensis TaxID=1347902 RepID=A0A917AWW7_9BACI|nr:sporulation protein YunB [Priestia taiwanensis]MBM7364547.1 sporulation protein YunB [Priestia taiwanensis]GGE80682.1 sporulation protein YunB [Priestia taiwanensis]